MKTIPLPYGLRNPYRNLKSEDTHDYVKKPQENCTFMNSASGRVKLLKGWLMEEGEETNQLTKEEGKVRTDTVFSAEKKSGT